MLELSAERLAILTSFGFDDTPDGEASYGFPASTYTLDTKIKVDGAHSTDVATVYYSVWETYEGDVLRGLFYYSSLLEYLLVEHGGEWDVDGILQDFREQTESDARLTALDGIPYLCVEVGEADWSTGAVCSKIEAVLKLISHLDNILPVERDRIREKTVGI